jgi:hypothetical protein
MKNIVMNFSRKEVMRNGFKAIVKKILSRMGKVNLQNGDPNLAALCFDFIGHTIVVDGLYERKELTIIVQWLKINNLIRGA